MTEAPLPARFAHVAHYDTLPKLLRHNARQFGGDIALREKKLGLWQTHTWKQYEDRAISWAIGLRTLGVGPGDVVAIIGESRPDWAAAAIGAHALRAKTLGLYQDALDAEVGYLAGFAEAKVIIVEDEMQADKMLRVTKDIASVKWVVYCEGRARRIAESFGRDCGDTGQRILARIAAHGLAGVPGATPVRAIPSLRRADLRRAGQAAPRSPRWDGRAAGAQSTGRFASAGESG